MLATNVDDDLPTTVAAFTGSLRDEHAPAEVLLADGDTESAMSEDVPAHHAEHNVILEDVRGPVSSVGSDEDFEESIAGEQELPSAVHDSEETFEVPDPPRIAVLQAAFRSMDEVDVCHQFRQTAAVMKSVQRFLKFSFCKALKVALNEIVRNREADLERGWKLLWMLPRMLLHRPPGGGKVAKSKLIARFEAFNRGEWINLVAASELCDDKAASARRRASRWDQDNLESRSLRAEMLVSLGDLSSARQALEDAELAPRNQATLNALRDPTRRRPRARAPLLDTVMTHVPHRCVRIGRTPVQS